ncbi:MAG: hypothetical protein J6W76_01835, partial [Spirochaetales bacterium]|nr:hypothetical protein [Spirochaetales bacterium]
TEVNVTCNGKTQTAKAGGGEIWWDMSSSFHKGIKGGKTYSVEFSANGGYSGKVTSQIDYWPKAEYTLLSPNSVTIYNGSAKTYQPPKYTMNYDVNQVTLKMTFKAFNTDGTEENIDTSAWQLAQMLDFLSKVENDGKRVEVHFSVTPKCNKGELVAAKGCMTYFCKADILIDKVEIRQEYDYYKAFLTDANGNEAGGKIVYKWEKSANGSSWTKISDVTTDIYKPKNEDLGNKLRVTITQTYGLESQTITKTSQSVDLLNIISETNLYYDGVVLTGTKIDFTKIKGVIKNLSGNEVNIADVSFNLVSQESLYTSQYVDLIIKKSLYSDKQISVYVPVQHSFSESELPKLSEKVRNITIGHATFAETDDDYSKLEFSLDNGVSWTILSTEEFAVKANDTILIRVKRIGTPNTIGYIMESKPLAITVKNQNIGLKDPAPFTITVSDVTLDTNAILTAKTNLPNGTSVTVLCNDVTFDNSVFDKNITINMQPAFRNVLGGSSCNVTFRSEGCVDASVNVTYWPKVTFSLLSPNVITIY